MADKHADSKRRLLDYLKRSAPSTAVDLAQFLGVTQVAVRQHLQQLQEQGLVISRTGPPRGRGRPPILWSLAEESRDLFPDRHGELVIELIDAVRATFGEEGIEGLLKNRGQRQAKHYRNAIPDGASLTERARTLARLRGNEGYMAEARVLEDGSVLLIEHHCPICEAARECQGLCATEIDVFRRALGRSIRVERSEHLLAGADRCVYRITKKG